MPGTTDAVALPVEDDAIVPDPVRPSRRPLSLRARLVLGILALLTLVIVVVGAASGFALRGFLIGQLDAKLLGAVERVDRPTGAGPDGGTLAPPGSSSSVGVEIPKQGPGTLGLLIAADGTTASGRLDQDGDTIELTATQIDEILAVADTAAAADDATGAGGSTAVTVALTDLGSYRIVTRELESGAGSLVIGLPVAEIDATVAQLWTIAGITGAIALLGTALLGTIVVRLALRPLDRVVATASEVSDLPLERDAALAVRVPDEDADERTEVGRVGAAINRMLDHVGDALESREASEATLRRFVADASHELRTPLASIRGYSELTRRSGEAVPEPISHALGRIESESVRMTGLVEDLLLLARLDEAKAIDAAPVDLTDLLVTAVSDAQVAGGDHEWEVDVPDAPVVVTGDAARLHQVAMNLLTNARRHTPAGSHVTARLRVEPGFALMEVEDDGDGIAPDLLPNVFGRFVRGDASRARATGSTGLGLAIVHAVATAHGGSAEVQSAPGRTVFRIRIPSE